MKMNPLDWIAVVLVVIGGLNWGLYGLLNMDLVNVIVGGFPPLNTIVYVLVALSALYLLYFALMKK